MQDEAPFFLDIRITNRKLQKISCEMKKPSPGYSKTQGGVHF